MTTEFADRLASRMDALTKQRLASDISFAVDMATNTICAFVPDADHEAIIRAAIRRAVNAGVDLGAGYMRAEFAGQGMKLEGRVNG